MVDSARAPQPEILPAPEQGQLVQVRNRLFLVQDVFPHESGITRLDLECLGDDRLGESLSVLWEREVHPRVHHADQFPLPFGRWDHPETFDAFLTAVRWSSSSVLRGSALQLAYRGAIELEPYQLEPAARAVLMPRVNLLIGDDTGLGKTTALRPAAAGTSATRTAPAPSAGSRPTSSTGLRPLARNAPGARQPSIPRSRARSEARRAPH